MNPSKSMCPVFFVSTWQKKRRSPSRPFSGKYCKNVSLSTPLPAGTYKYTYIQWLAPTDRQETETETEEEVWNDHWICQRGLATSCKHESIRVSIQDDLLIDVVNWSPHPSTYKIIFFHPSSRITHFFCTWNAFAFAACCCLLRYLLIIVKYHQQDTNKWLTVVCMCITRHNLTLVTQI